MDDIIKKGKTGRKQDLPRDFQKMNWDPKPGQTNIQRIKRLMATQNTKQERELQTMPTPENVQTNYSKIFVWNDGKWHETGVRCMDCGKVMSKPQVIEKHPLICDKAMLIDKEEDFLKYVKKSSNNR